MRTLRFLLRKEFLQIRRDHTMVAQIILMPVIQLIILSSAATFEVKHAAMYVVDDDRTELSRALVQRLVASRRFVPSGASASMARASDAMLARKADLILHIPADFERDLVRTRHAPVQIVLDAENGAAAGVTQAYAGQIVARYAAELQQRLHPDASVAGGAVERSPRPGMANLELRTRGWYNAELDYRDYMIPGILVQLVTMVGTMLTAMNIVREKEIGTLDQLNVTPVTRGTFVAAKLLPLWSIALLELTVGLIVARLLFEVPIRGSIPLIFLGGAIYLVVALGIGLWISTLVETQQQAMFITFFVMMIYLLMSGLFTPVRSMPAWAQWLAQLNPVMHFIRMMRAVMLKGAGIADVYPALMILAVYGAVVLTLAVRQYSKRSG
jgi:ABC-2 type transport system permease protein